MSEPPKLPGSQGVSELPRVLGMWSAASILIGSIIGSGIFVKPAKIATDLPSPGWILVCWVVAGALALIGSLVFAELGSYYPGAGGQYTFILKSFGRLPAFLFGWTNLAIINSASIAALAVIAAQYGFYLLPEAARPAPGSHWLKTAPCLVVAALTAVNAIGVRWGAALQNFLTVAKLGALAMLFVAVFIPGKMEWSNLSPFWEVRLQGSAGGSPGAGALLTAFNAAFLSIFWAYDGWYLLSFSGAEIKNPRRNIPAGFIAGILIVIGVYVITTIAFFGVLDLESMKGATGQGGAAAEVARRLYGSPGVVLLALGIAASTLGAANGNILTGPRLSYAMAHDGLFFRRFGGVHARYLTPLFSIVAQGILGAAYVYLGSFDQLTEHVVFAAWVFYLLTVLACFRQRRLFADQAGVFRAPGHPILPLAFVIFAAAFIAYSFWESAALAVRYLKGDAEAAAGVYPLISAAVMLAGVPLYWLFRQRGQDRA